jgi:predicted dehydrogenase
MTGPASSQHRQHDNSLNRRGFLAGASAAGVTLMKPELVFGTQANTKVRLGLIGCGGRGTWIANLFAEHGGYEIAAAADYFPERVENVGNRFKIAAAKRFAGLSCHKRMLDSKVDAVAIESPPYFHPEQALAAADAGCHVFVAKPIAVDVPGCLTIADAGKKATANKKCFLVDFQTRTSEFYIEGIKRVHAGDIGPLVSGESVYYCGTTWGGNEALAADPKKPENRLRAWGLDRVLSGDIITEQNIHSLDVATWIVDQAPVKAYGTCGRGGRTDPGDCNGHFHVVFFFPNNVLVTFASKQYGSGYDDIGNKMFGPKGTLETHYGGLCMIRGEKSYKGGRQPGIYQEGAVANIATFHASIVKGDCTNPTVAPSVRSNLTTIVGRTAAYKRAEVTWDEVLQAKEKFEFDTAGLKS